MKLLLLFSTVILMAGCNQGVSGDQEAKDNAEEWADAYFNCDYMDAKEYVTQESQKWLEFAASNTTEQDMKLLQEAGGAHVTVGEVFDEANDTMRLVTLMVTNYLKPVALGKAPELEKEGTFKVAVVKRADGWQVRMEGLPRSEKQSRD